MFGWFRPRCPLDVREKTWVELRMRWLIERFGAASIQSLDVITPTDRYFPEVYSGQEAEVEHLFGRVCDWIGVRRSEVELRLFDEHIPSSYIAYGDVSPLGVYVQRKAAGERHIVWVQRSPSTDPLQFTSIAAHELAHCILLGDEWLNDSVGDHEFITDLLPVVRGLGIFAANSATVERTHEYSHWSYRGVSKQGYLPARMFGYGMAVLAWIRGEERPDWGRYLSHDARSTFQDGLRYLFRANDCRCPQLAGASTDRPFLARRGIESDVAGEFVSALWEFRKPECPSPNHAEWASIIGGLNHRDPVVVAETALAIAALKRADLAVTEKCLWHLRDCHDNADLRSALALALGTQTATHEVVEELTRMLDGPSGRVIKCALLALGHLQPKEDPVVVPTILRVMRKGIIDRDENLLLHVAEALRALSESPGKLVAAHFAKDRELQQLAFGAMQIEADGTQLITPFLPNAESLPVPLPDWRPDSHHMEFLDEEEGGREAD